MRCARRWRRTLFGLWLLLLLGTAVLAVPWRFEGQVFMPGSAEPSDVALPERHWAPLFAPPEVDPEALGLGVADERFQVQLRAVRDTRLQWILIGGALLPGVVVTAVSRLRERR